MGRWATAIAVWAALAPPAAAQSADPIGDILGKITPEMEEPDLASQPVRLEAGPEASLPSQPIPYSQTVPQAGAFRPQPYAPSRPVTAGVPTLLEETGKSPDGPPTIRDLAYESRLRASFASAQGFQGPMDGGWVLADGNGRELYRLQLADRGRGVVEGAWRDPRRPGQADASGFIDQIERTGSTTVLRFDGGPEGAVTATFQGSGTALSGQVEEAGRRMAATLRRVSQP
jgi:hypothetical protein